MGKFIAIILFLTRIVHFFMSTNVEILHKYLDVFPIVIALSSYVT